MWTVWTPDLVVGVNSVSYVSAALIAIQCSSDGENFWGRSPRICKLKQFIWTFKVTAILEQDTPGGFYTSFEWLEQIVGL